MSQSTHILLATNSKNVLVNLSCLCIMKNQKKNNFKLQIVRVVNERKID